MWTWHDSGVTLLVSSLQEASMSISFIQSFFFFFRVRVPKGWQVKLRAMTRVEPRWPEVDNGREVVEAREAARASMFAHPRHPLVDNSKSSVPNNIPLREVIYGFSSSSISCKMDLVLGCAWDLDLKLCSWFLECFLCFFNLENQR